MKIKSSEITPENIYKNRRKFLKDVGVIAGTALLSQNIASSAFSNTEKIERKITEYRYITTYNNYYEFGTGKNHPVERSQNFITDPWSITIDGEVDKKVTLSMDHIKKMFPAEREYIV